jgi:UDP-N-acetylglucosamine acyltransferase
MPGIHPTAIIERGAEIAAGVEIGPYCIIGPRVVIHDGCRLVANVHVTGHSVIGARTVIYPFASLGTPPQSTKYRGGPTQLIVGADCDIRESVTMNTGTEDDRGVTEVGSRCFFMAGSHVGHDCQVGDEVILANNAVLGGHAVIGSHAFLGGQAAVHQHVRVGEGAMVSGVSGVAGDLIPFGFAMGQYAYLQGLNVIGMRRRGYARADLHRLRRAYRTLFLGEGLFRDRVADVADEFAGDPLIAMVVDFIRSGEARPLMMPPPRGAAGQAHAAAVP